MVSTSRHQSARNLPWLALLIWAALTNSKQADIQPSFTWGFMTLPSTILELPECGQLKMFVDPLGGTTAPNPPYFLIAYEVGGIPTVQAVGSEVNNLFWTVDHASQTQLVISMADAAGNAGGISPSVYTVVPGSSTACHASSKSSSVSLTTNATNSIASCDVLAFKMSGGTKPYNISIAVINTAATINFTLASTSDTLNWVNRAPPNAQIISSVSDANGVYAVSTNLITTSGTTDLTCGNRPSTESDSTSQSSGSLTSSSSPPSSSSPSSSSPSSSSPPPSSPPSSSSSHSSSTSPSSSSKPISTTTIISVIVGVVVILGLAALGVLFYMRQQRNKGRSPGNYDAVSTNNDAEMSREPQMLARQSSYSVPSNIPQGYTWQQNVAPSVLSPPASTTLPLFDPYEMARTSSNLSGSTGPRIVEPPVGAAYAAYDGFIAESYPRAPEAGPSSGVLALTNPATLSEIQGPVSPPVLRQSVYQHEDISDVIELPPAYRERSDPSNVDL